MKLQWVEYRDEGGHTFAALPYVIRAYGVGPSGQITYRLEGGGCDSRDTDVDRLKREAQREADRAALRARLGA